MGFQLIMSQPRLWPSWRGSLAERLAGRFNDLRSWLAGAYVIGLPAAIKSMSWTHDGTQKVSAPAQTATQAVDLLPQFQRLVVPELDAAYSFARYLCRDADAAQDIVQTAFLRAYRGFGIYRGGDARAWILAIVRNCYHDWLTERRRKGGFEADYRHRMHDDEDSDAGIEDVPSPDDTPEAALLRKSETECVRLVLTRLPRPLREVLILREIEGLSYRQIAEIASVPIGTVMSRLARARREFGEAWQKESGEQETIL